MQFLGESLALLLLSLARFSNSAKTTATGADDSGDRGSQKILFLTNSESGLGNVVLATSYAILVNYPSIEVHLASFAKFAEPAATLSEHARRKSPSSQGLHFHEINGSTYAQSIVSQGMWLEEIINGPGFKGQAKFLGNLGSFLLPWTGPEYVQLQRDLTAKIEDIDPDVIVMEAVISPGIDAARRLGRRHVILSANSLKDVFALQQPMGAGFWKYPALSSGIPYPVPWHLIPLNLFLNVRLVYTLLSSPTLKAKMAYVESQGLKNPHSAIDAYQPDVPWLSPSRPEIEYPMEIPPNVTPCGPIFLSISTVADRDPELATWLAGAPTVLINLGSGFAYNETDGAEMVGALTSLLDSTNVQILWKFNKRYPYSDDFRRPIEGLIQSGRVRMETWITADPASLLESGHIVLSVHHGGANCYHEALGTGVPSLVLPVWADLYDYATKVEWLGVGIWANKKTAPEWTAEELGQAFARAIGDGEEAKAMREKAKGLGDLVAKDSGRDVAARTIVEYMNSGVVGGPSKPVSNLREKEL